MLLTNRTQKEKFQVSFKNKISYDCKLFFFFSALGLIAEIKKKHLTKYM